jgi:ATP-dependent RNA helicase DDX31/DBP7
VKELEEESLLLAEMTIEQVLQKLFKNAIPSTKTGQMPHNLEESATNLQMKLELAVANNEDLHGQASQAYVSYVRSYASYPKEIRHIFCFKDLHLGHIAKSYALRDPPSKITGIGKGNWVKNDQRKQQKNNLKDEEKVIKAQKKRINQKQLVMSEYASGFDGIDLNAVKKQEKVKKPKYKKNRTKLK